MGIIAVPNPNHEGGSAVTRSFRTGEVKHADSFSVARVRPRTSKGITDLLLLTVTRLDAACPSKKSRDGRESREQSGGPTGTDSAATADREFDPPTDDNHAADPHRP